MRHFSIIGFALVLLFLAAPPPTYAAPPEAPSDFLLEVVLPEGVGAQPARGQKVPVIVEIGKEADLWAARNSHWMIVKGTDKDAKSFRLFMIKDGKMNADAAFTVHSRRKNDLLPIKIGETPDLSDYGGSAGDKVKLPDVK